MSGSKKSNEENENEDVKSFLNLLKKEFTVNEFMNKYGKGDYSNTPNVPYEHRDISKNPCNEIDFPDYVKQLPEIPPYQSDKKILPYRPYRPYVIDPLEQRRIERENEFEEALREFERGKERERAEKARVDRYVQDNIERFFVDGKSKKKNEKREAFKAAFIQLIADRITFDDDNNLVDENGNIVNSIGAFGLLFIRILNSVLESKKSAEDHEKDLKNILK